MEQDPGKPPVVLRVYLNPHVDLELTAEAGRAYAAADEQGHREMAGQLLADQIEAAGFEEARVAAGSRIATGRSQTFRRRWLRLVSCGSRSGYCGGRSLRSRRCGPRSPSTG